MQKLRKHLQRTQRLLPRPAATASRQAHHHMVVAMPPPPPATLRRSSTLPWQPPGRPWSGRATAWLSSAKQPPVSPR